MRTNRFGAAVAAIALLAPALAAPAVAQDAAAQPGAAPGQAVADVVVNMRDVEIADVAEQISRITGRTLILDPNVKGIVNVTSAEPLSVSGVWDLFQSVLRVHGFAAVRSGRAWRIIPQANALRDAGSGGIAARAANGQDVVSRLIRLRNMNAEQAVRVFRPLINSFGSVEALTSPNAVVVTDYGENVRRIERLAASLDSGAGGFESIPLRYATARDVATAIQGVMGEGTRVVGDERSNTVLLRGEPNMLAEARRLARTLDTSGGATPTTRVFRLAFADAETVTDVLRGLAGEEPAATNPVARSLSSRRNERRGLSSLGRGGGGTAQELASVIGAGGLQGGSGLGAGSLGLGGTAVRENGIATLGGSPGGVGEERTQGQAAQGFSTPELTVQPAPELNAIVVRGTPAALATIEPIITELDVRRPQVLIEAAIVEINGEEAEALGVQLGFGGLAQIPNVGGTSFSNIGSPLSSILTVLGVPAGNLLGNGLNLALTERNDFSILVQALGTSTKANLLSTPSITTLDNAPAEIVVGQNVPFVTGSFGTDGNSLNPFQTIEREDVGITLRVIPRVHEGDTVRLEVSQEVSSLTGANVQGAADLVTNRRSIDTTVLADDGQTIVLGGLITDDRNRLESRVPVLGDVPVVGELFKSRRNNTTKRTLFVFLRPTILRDSAAAEAVTGGKYARLRGDEAALNQRGSLLINPPPARLGQEIQGIY